MLQERGKTLGIDSPAATQEKGVQSEEESFSLFFQKNGALRQIDVRLDKHSAQDVTDGMYRISGNISSLIFPLSDSKGTLERSFTLKEPWCQGERARGTD